MRQALQRLALVAFALAVPAVSRADLFFKETDLVTNDQAAHPAKITDPSLVNAWGVSFSPTSPFWVSDNGTGVSTLYRVNPTTDAVSKIGLTVSIPGAG